MFAMAKPGTRKMKNTTHVLSTKTNSRKKTTFLKGKQQQENNNRKTTTGVQQQENNNRCATTGESAGPWGIRISCHKPGHYKLRQGACPG
jgi:hypothetical protein